MKYPLVPVALCYVGGLLVADFYQLPLRFLFILSIGLALGAFIVSAFARRSWLIWPLLFFAGATNLTWRSTVLSPCDLRRLLPQTSVPVQLRGVLCETPSQRVFMRDERQVPRFLANLRVEEIRLESVTWRPAVGQVLVATPGILPEQFFKGEQVEVDGSIAPPPRALAEGLFDYQSYLRRQGIHFQLKAHSTNDWQLVSRGKSPPLEDRFLDWAQAALARGLPQEDEPLRLLWSMTLGWKAGLTNDNYIPFMKSGTMHIFAVSGLHIVLIAEILVGVLRLLRFPREFSGWAVIPLIWFYTGATGWQPSAIRSTVMMSIIIAGWALRRPSNLLNSLAAAAFIILLWDPQQLFGASFQLSFFVVLSLALFIPPIQARMRKLTAHDPFLPATFVPQWRRKPQPASALAHSFSGHINRCLGWFASVVCAYYFHLFSPVTLFANLIIVPLSSAALACNMGTLLTSGLPGFTFVSELFNHSAWLWMSWMVSLSDWFARWPCGSWYVRSFTTLDFIVYYGLLIGLFSGWLLTRKRLRWTIATCALIAVIYSAGWLTSRQTVEITVLPLTSGSSIFCDGPGRNDWLIDTGDRDSFHWITKPFLQGQGINRLSNLVLTHGDTRHVDGATILKELFHPGRIWVSGTSFRSVVYRRVISAFEKQPGTIHHVNAEDVAGPWKVLHPASGDRFRRADDGSLVLLGQFHGTRVLILSDLSVTGQKQLLERSLDLHANIIIASGTAGQDLERTGLLDAVKPQAVLFCDPELGFRETEPPAWGEGWKNTKVLKYDTVHSGALRIVIGRNHWEVLPHTR